MKRSKRLSGVCDVFASRQHEAVAQMVEAERALDAASARLEELGTYRADYSRRLAAGRCADPRALADLAVFIRRLDDAIEAQRNQVEQLRQQHEGSRGAWLRSRQRHSAISNARDRIATDETRVVERQEQQQADETSADSLRRPVR